MKPVIELRNIQITKKPIIYSWWFKNAVLDLLLAPLQDEVDSERITSKEDYSLLYIGSGINGHERLVKYHILDTGKFHEKGVENRRLSSLRQTLCGLLRIPMSEGLERINEFMNQNCKVNWFEADVENKKLLGKIEKEQIRANYLPLNWQHTKGMLSDNHRRLLTQLKDAVRF
jgi:hypothetical protein